VFVTLSHQHKLTPVLARVCRCFVPCSASSQVFFLLKESELTPSGANLLDGRYAVFGYAVSGQDYLGLMKVGGCGGGGGGGGGGALSTGGNAISQWGGGGEGLCNCNLCAFLCCAPLLARCNDHPSNKLL
jgi:hypothetical protein